MDRIWRFFHRPPEEGAAETGNQHDARVAACALLLEMADVDGEFDGPERERILEILIDRFGLEREDAEGLAREARRELSASVDLWRFANRINENYPVEKKLEVMEQLWEVVFADGRLEAHEDYLVHKLAHLLRLTHDQLIQAKLRARENSRR